MLDFFRDQLLEELTLCMVALLREQCALNIRAIGRPDVPEKIKCVVIANNAGPLEHMSSMLSLLASIKSGVPTEQPHNKEKVREKLKEQIDAMVDMARKFDVG